MQHVVDLCVLCVLCLLWLLWNAWTQSDTHDLRVDRTFIDTGLTCVLYIMTSV